MAHLLVNLLKKQLHQTFKMAVCEVLKYDNENSMLSIFLCSLPRSWSADGWQSISLTCCTWNKKANNIVSTIQHIAKHRKDQDFPVCLTTYQLNFTYLY